MALLRIEFRETQTVVSLRGTETTVGRSNRCTVNLPDPALAEVHFRIQLKSRGYRLKDDGSGIGTLVNGKEVFATTLTHGDVIQAGGVRCVFLERAEDPEAASAPPRRAPRTPTHEAPSVPVRAAAPRRRKSQSQTYVLAGVGLAVVAVVAILLMGRSADQEAHLIWKEAQRSLEASRTDLKGTEAHLEEAVRLLEELRREYPGARVSRTAGISLDDTRNVLRVLKEVEGEKDAIQRVRDEEAELDAFARLARLRETGHPAVLARVESLESLLKEARKERLLALYREAEERVRTLLNERRFAEADRVWSEFQAGDYFLHQRAEGERTKVRKKTSEEYRKLLRLATRAGDLDARIGMLEASRPVFKGTRHADDLEVRVSALRARRTQREIVVLNERKPPTKTEKPTREEDKPEEIPTGPHEDPPKVAELVRQRRYGEAASLLNSITRHPAAKVRTEELTLLANLMADLAAAVRARPQEFDKVLLPGGVGRGDAVDADPRFLKIRKAGKETRYPWSDLPAKSYVRLFRQAGFEKPPRLAAAVFFDEESLPREAQQAYVAFFRSELAPTTLTRILARRRGIDPPGGGFQLFRGQLVTTDERDAILLGEEVEKLGKKGLSTNERLRLKAWADLEALGLPAVETLTRVIRERRELVAGELKKSKAFTPTRFASRFGKELAQRRKDALKFILDANAYPYPNKTKAAQDRAEALVDEVRELYETPFDELLASSEGAQALSKELEGLDARLAKIDPLAEPFLDRVVDEITARLDMRTVAIDDRDRKRIEYNLAVEKHNAGLKKMSEEVRTRGTAEAVTSADLQERSNVRAVNEYRWMMGLHAVKLDERLLRAARKHSIEMQQMEYFAHDSPTKHLRTPGMRAKRDGYGGGVSENIARGASSGRQAFEQWFKSSGHHRNMVIPGHTEMGCGAANHHWWTQLFGRMTGRGLSPPKIPPDPDPPGTSGNGMPAPGGGE